MHTVIGWFRTSVQRDYLKIPDPLYLLKMSIDAIQARLDLSDSDLWLTLGSEVIPGFGSRDPKFLIAAAKAWFESQLMQLRTAICGNQLVTIARESGDGSLLLTAIYDVIVPIYGGTPAATAVVLVVRYGVDKLCKPDETL